MKLRTILGSGAILSVFGAIAGGAAISAPSAPVSTPPAVAPAPAGPALTPEQTEFFEGKIRPIFVKNCYQCHSVEKGKAKGSLVLDSREGLLKGGDAGSALTPGDPAKSLLVKAVSYADGDLQMPPKDKGGKLTDAEIADITTWVKMGAPDPRASAPGKLSGLTDKARSHWAYQPVKYPDLPVVKNKAWIKSPVDAFVLAKLEENGMAPAKPCNRETLLRRVTYDLIGLPPTVEELDAFNRDLSATAYEKVIDRLLASPHYGERWGRFWLDTARYSDTTGLEQENRATDYRYAFAWTYRDWVIKAFNDDMPYDQFIRSQIAADLQPDADKHPDNLAALGFITVGKRFADVNDVIDERIDTISKATMALTVSCARCHDHKFDPIPTADYYSMHGMLASTVEPKELPIVGHIPTGAEASDFKKKFDALEQKNRDAYYDTAAEKSAEFRKQAAAYLMGLAYNRRGEGKDVEAKRKLIEEYKLDTQMLQRLKIRGEGKDVVFAPFHWFEQAGDKVGENASEILNRIAKADKRKVNPLVAAAFKKVSASSIKSLQDVADVYGKVFAAIDGKAKSYIAAARVPGTTAVSGYDADVVEVIDCPIKIEPSADMTQEHIREVAASLMIGNNPFSKFYYGAINELELTHPGCPARAMAVADASKPHDSPIFIKGEKSNKGPIVPRRFLEIIAGKNREAFRNGSGRFEFAEAVASKDNPLTARVAVNRIWMHHFGEGFVRTLDDMGVQCENPSHPELLDYLATRLMADKWSIKTLHKRILLSNAYQQSADTNATYAVKDPENRLLWRANVRRLDFEAIRDTMVLFTGKLDRAVGGRPVNLVDEPYSNRRSVYGYIDRGNIPELLQQFDFGDPNRANSRRTSTIVPQQALFFMNSPMSADVVHKVTTRPEFLAARDDYGRVRALYRVLYQREPRGAEMRFAADFFNAHAGMKSVVLNAPAAKGKVEKTAGGTGEKMSTGGEKKAIQNEGETVDRRPLSLWEQYAQTLLMTNEIAYLN